MLFEIEDTGSGFTVSSRKLTLQPVADLGLLEKDIEHWIADHPQLLLPGEPVLVIGQSIAGRAMADVLALDQFGHLVIVEIKRHRTGRDTIAQLLGYAARLRNVTYDELNAIAQNYDKWKSGELFDAFTAELSDSGVVGKDQLGRKQRVIIVAPGSDEDLRDIVDWLHSYSVPIEFVPFAVYADDTLTPRYFQIEGVQTQTCPMMSLAMSCGLITGFSIRMRPMPRVRIIGCLNVEWRQFMATLMAVVIWRIHLRARRCSRMSIDRGYVLSEQSVTELSL